MARYAALVALTLSGRRGAGQVWLLGLVILVLRVCGAGVVFFRVWVVGFINKSDIG